MLWCCAVPRNACVKYCVLPFSCTCSLSSVPMVLLTWRKNLKRMSSTVLSTSSPWQCKLATLLSTTRQSPRCFSILSAVVLLCLLVAKLQGRPFMMSLYHNKPLLYSLVFSVIVLFMLASGAFPSLSDTLEIVTFPEEVWKKCVAKVSLDQILPSLPHSLSPLSFKGSSCLCC